MEKKEKVKRFLWWVKCSNCKKWRRKGTVYRIVEPSVDMKYWKGMCRKCDTNRG